MIKIPELNIEVVDDYDFELKATNIFDKFCHDLRAKRGSTRRVTSDEKSYAEHEGISFFWKSDSAKKLEDKQNEIRGIGMKYFGKDFTIRTSMYIK